MMKCKFYELDFNGVRSEIPYTRFTYYMLQCDYVLLRNLYNTMTFVCFDRRGADNCPEVLYIDFDYLPEEG